jgi:predicted RNA binding protein YcfA (HicA-like mRNA interferase family)
VLKSLKWRKLVQKLRRLGFDGPYSGGRHLFMVKGRLKLRIPNPHRGDVSKDLLAEILRQAGISAEDWEKS